MPLHEEAPQAPDAVYTKQRWIPPQVVDWVKECDAIMRKHGHVQGGRTYTTRDRARWPPRRLRDLMIDLHMYEGWQLIEHVGRTPSGYVWSLEYRPREER